jgi:hypothetical protein
MPKKPLLKPYEIAFGIVGVIIGLAAGGIITVTYINIV